MRPKLIMIILAVLIVAGIAAAVIYQQNQNMAQVESAPVATSTESPAPTAEASPGASTAPVAGTLDLTTDANGLSKTTVVIATEYGNIKFKFYPKDAPNTVARIAELIQSGFYNGLKFHRVVPGFVVQGGDPSGTGAGGSGKNLKAEFNQRRHLDGTVAMARAMDPDSADSQFYITLGPQPHLDRSYTVFGQVIEGMDAVRKIKEGDVMTTVKFE